MNLRDLAKGRDCLIRIPGECLRSPETVVLCHYRMSGLSGMGLKSPDWCAAYGCARCHDIVDGRRGSWIAFPLELRKLFLAEAVLRTLTLLAEEGLLHVGKIKGLVELQAGPATLPKILPRRTGASAEAGTGPATTPGARA
jgi:hypothetical protein